MNLEIQTREGETVAGVWRDRSRGWPEGLKAWPEGMDGALADTFAKAQHPGDSNKWWSWSRTLPSEHGNWSAAPALFAMHSRRSEFVQYLADRILEAHRISAPVIDRFLLGSTPVK